MSAICEFFLRNQNTYEKYIFRHDLPYFGKSLSKNQYSLHVSKTPLLFEKPELGHSNPYSRNLRLKQGRIQIFWKKKREGASLCCPPRLTKILGFRWSKKAKITLKTISFWPNISIGIFKFSPILYTMKACRWNLINFLKLTNAFIRKEKKLSYSSQWEKKNWEKLEFVLKQVVL